MSWRQTSRQRFVVPERIRASAQHGTQGDLSPDRLAAYVDAVVSRHSEIGTLSADDEAWWRRHLSADLAGACQLLVEREEQQLRQQIADGSRGNGSFAARRPDDGEQLIGARR